MHPAFLLIPAVLLGIYALHRFALWAEDRGWIYYMRKKASPNALGNAALGLQQILQPGAKHVLEVRENRRAERDDSGGSDRAGDGSGTPESHDSSARVRE